MCNKLKRHFAVIFADTQFMWIFVASILMTICHVYMMIDSKFMIEPTIRVAYCCIWFPMALIFGRKWMPFQFLIIAFSILYFNKWLNPTSFLLVATVAFWYPKYRNHLFVIYGAAVLVCLGLAHRNFAHMTLHCIYCVGIYFVLLGLKQSLQAQSCLILTLDEKDILSQLSAGKLRKEIDGFSKNTITKKIQEAMERNNCSTEGELIHRYKENKTPFII